MFEKNILEKLMKTETILILVGITVVLVCIYMTRCGCGKEKFCSVAPRFDYYYSVNRGHATKPPAFPTGYVQPEGQNTASQNTASRCQKTKPFDRAPPSIFAQNEFMEEWLNKENIDKVDYKGDIIENFTMPKTPQGPEFSLGAGATPGAQHPPYTDLGDCDPFYKNAGKLAKEGAIQNSDTIGSINDPGCRVCGGDYISVAPKRDFYFQPEMGRLGEGINSGYPFYKAY